MFTLIDCKRNATSHPTHVIYDTWNLNEVARIGPTISGAWAIWNQDGRGGFRLGTERFLTVEAAFAKYVADAEAEAQTP